MWLRHIPWPKRNQKSFFKYGEHGEDRAVACDWTHEEKILKIIAMPGNQPLSLDVLFYSTDSSGSCSFTKQDLTFRQLCLVSVSLIQIKMFHRSCNPA